MLDGWRKVALGDICACSSGSTPKAGDERYYKDGTVPFVKIGDLNDSFISSTETTVTEIAVRECRLHVLEPGTVLLAMYGSIGKNGVLGIPATTNQAILAFDPDISEIEPRFLHYALLRHQSEFAALGRGATQRNINKQIVEAFEILLPSLEEQRRIIDLVSHLDGEITAQQESVRAATYLRTALLTTLLAGAHEIPESYDRFLGEIKDSPEPDLVTT